MGAVRTHLHQARRWQPPAAGSFRPARLIRELVSPAALMKRGSIRLGCVRSGGTGSVTPGVSTSNPTPGEWFGR